MNDPERCAHIAIRYRAWLEAFEKAERALRQHRLGCKRCKTVDGETLLCDQTPVFPPNPNYDDLR